MTELTVRALLESATTDVILTVIADALNVLDEREQPPAENERLQAEALAQDAGILRDRETGKFGVVYYSEANAVAAALERGTNTRGEELAQAYEEQRAI